jgi:thiamine-monophosphate kinase
VGEQLRLIASAVIDVSDGLLADLRHLTDSSEVGAKVDVNRIPVSAEMLLFASPDEALSLALTAGDDYELCFSANTSSRGQIEKLAVSTSVLITRIGSIVKTPGIALSGEGAGALDIESTGYQHF